MLTSEAVASYVTSIRAVRAIAARTVAAIWRELPEDPVEAREALIPAVVTVIGAFGDIVAVSAAGFYDQVRDRPGFEPVLAPPAPASQIGASIRWAVGPLFSTEPDRPAGLSRVESVVERITVNQGHETVYLSGSADPGKPKFARVPVGDTCAWCRLMASRGAVFRTEATAKFRRSHAKCDCKVVPVFDGDELPYDRQALLDEYQAARREADKKSVKQITAVMRAGTETG